LLVFLLVSEEQELTANSAIPNEGIERVARKNDGASACRTRRPPELARRLTTAAKRIALRCG